MPCATKGNPGRAVRATVSQLTIDLDVKQHLAQVREKQRGFIKNRLVNLEFQVVSFTEKMWSKVGIELTGMAPAVKNFNTVLVGTWTP